jgi:hypothetical protein
MNTRKKQSISALLFKNNFHIKAKKTFHLFEKESSSTKKQAIKTPLALMRLLQPSRNPRKASQ